MSLADELCDFIPTLELDDTGNVQESITEHKRLFLFLGILLPAKHIRPLIMKKSTRKVEALYRQLNEARHRERHVRRQIGQLVSLLKKAGEFKKRENLDFASRNKKLYDYWCKGMSFSSLGKEFGLAASTVAYICHKMRHNLKKECIQ